MKIKGDNLRPRLVVKRSLKNLSAQLIDDTKQRTLFSLSTYDKEIKKKFTNAGNIKSAESFAELFAKEAKDKGITKLIFDRAGYLYHGRIKAFAEGLKKAGIEF